MDNERLAEELDFLLDWEKSLVEEIDKKLEYLEMARSRIYKIKKMLDENS